MGADLLLTYVEVKETREQAQKRLDNLVLTEEDLGRFEDTGYYFWEDEEFSEEVAKQMREKLQTSLNCVYDVAEGKTYAREVTTFTIDGNRTFLITGGMSWGDEPSDFFSDFWIFFEFLGYPSHLSPDSQQAKEWEAVNA